MGKYTTFTLKVNPQYEKEVYRILQIDGNSTLDALSSAILSAFQFDDEHLYMYSMNRKRYDSEGIFHPNTGRGKNAAKVKLGSLGLKAKNKFLFLYDFGDEWLFDITVKKVEQSDVRTLTFVSEGVGEIEQYPDCDDESWFDEIYGEDEENMMENQDNDDDLNIQETSISMAELLSRQNISDLEMMMQALAIKKPARRKGLSSVYSEEIVRELISSKAKILNLLTPGAAVLLQNIVNRNIEGIGSNMTGLDILENCGLIDILEDRDSFSISFTKEAKLFSEYIETDEIRENLNLWCKLDDAISALMNIYGLIETKYLHQLLCELLNINIDFETLREKVLNQKAMWGEIQMLLGDNGKTSIVSLFENQEAEYIFRNRNKYKVKKYKEISGDGLQAITCGDFSRLVPGFDALAEYLLGQINIDTEDFLMLCSAISKACLLGIDQDDILQFCEEALESFNINFTNKIKKLISDIILQHPCALLKGYSFGEYKNGGSKNRQLSFFDDELPF